MVKTSLLKFLLSLLLLMDVSLSYQVQFEVQNFQLLETRNKQREEKEEEEKKKDYEVWTRSSPDEFIKLVVVKGRVVGGMLVGETDLEEAVENLVLNRLFVGDIGIHLLDPEIDMEDFLD